MRPNSDYTLAHYVAIARRRVWIVLAFMAIVAVVATLVALSKPARYEATSTVLINRQSLANQIAGGSDVGLQQQSFQQVLTTQAKLARTPAVLRAAIARGNSKVDFDAFESGSAVTANRDSDLLNFSVVRPDAEDAKRLASAYAEAYVSYRRRLDTTALQRAVDDVDRAIVDARRAGRSQAQLVQRLTTSRQELETRMALQTSNAQLVAEPEEAVKVQPRPVRAGIMGLLFGFVVGVLVAAVRHALDTRIRSSKEVESTLRLPTLARIGSPPTGERDDDIVMLADPRGAHAEAFRLLRTNVNFGIQTHEARVIMVSSATQGEGKSTTIANLATAFATAGKNVALLDLDLRRPTLARLFGLGGAAGATSVALGEASFDEALVKIDLPDYGQNFGASTGSLHVMTSGPLPPDPGEFVGSDRVRDLITRLRAEFDVVFVDAPPLVAVSDTQVIAELADAVFLCVRLGVVHRPLLAEFRRSLDRVTVPVLGQVLTGADSDDDFNYHSSYGYGYAYDESVPAKKPVPAPVAAEAG